MKPRKLLTGIYIRVLTLWYQFQTLSILLLVWFLDKLFPSDDSELEEA